MQLTNHAAVCGKYQALSPSYPPSSKKQRIGLWASPERKSAYKKKAQGSQVPLFLLLSCFQKLYSEAKCRLYIPKYSYLGNCTILCLRLKKDQWIQNHSLGASVHDCKINAWCHVALWAASMPGKRMGKRKSNQPFAMKVRRRCCLRPQVKQETNLDP